MTAQIDVSNLPDSLIQADSIPFEPTRKIVYIDGKEVPEYLFFKKIIRGELILVGGALGKDAIKRYGEKYRYDVLFCESVEKEDYFRINGVIDNQFDNKDIMLFSFREDTIFKVDTATVINGRFYFEGQEDLHDFAIISIGNYPEKVKAIDVILERGHTKVDMDNDSIEGGQFQNLYQNYQDSVANRLADMKFKVLTESSWTIETPEVAQQLDSFKLDFLRNNVSNLVGQKILRDEAFNGFYRTSCFDAFNIVYDAMDDSLKDASWVQALKTQMEEYERRFRVNLTGKPYQDFECWDLLGEKKKLSDYVGKSACLIVDFWASWCGPCIADIPSLKELYDKYHDKGVEVVSVSLDAQRPAWERALKKIDAPWTHLLILDANTEQAIKQYYSFQGIPFMIVLDKSGTIIGTPERASILLQNFDTYLDIK